MADGVQVQLFENCQVAKFGYRLVESLEEGKTLNSKERHERAFHAMKRLMTDETGDLKISPGAKRQRLAWNVFGEPCCRPFFEWAFGISDQTCTKLRKQIMQGWQTLPDVSPVPRMPAQRVIWACPVVDSWFLDLYLHLALACPPHRK